MFASVNGDDAVSRDNLRNVMIRLRVNEVSYRRTTEWSAIPLRMDLIVHAEKLFILEELLEDDPLRAETFRGV